MKLLLDENLSRRLVPFLLRDYPGSESVVSIGLEAASDRHVWEHARDNGFVIVTRDADFGEMSAVFGQPPKVVRIRTPHLTKAATLDLLLGRRGLIEEALLERDLAVVELWP
ncbi:MAG: DUF5615 family PIN-like protein [Rubrivivax sp.]